MGLFARPPRRRAHGPFQSPFADPPVFRRPRSIPRNRPAGPSISPAGQNSVPRPPVLGPFTLFLHRGLRSSLSTLLFSCGAVPRQNPLGRCYLALCRVLAFRPCGLPPLTKPLPTGPCSALSGLWAASPDGLAPGRRGVDRQSLGDRGPGTDGLAGPAVAPRAGRRCCSWGGPGLRYSLTAFAQGPWELSTAKGAPCHSVPPAGPSAVSPAQAFTGWPPGPCPTIAQCLGIC